MDHACHGLLGAVTELESAPIREAGGAGSPILCMGAKQGKSRRNDAFLPSFEFLDYCFTPTGLTVAASTMERFVARASRLYEQERRARQQGTCPVASPSPLGLYVQRWQGWVGGGLTTTGLVPPERVVRMRNARRGIEVMPPQRPWLPGGPALGRVQPGATDRY